jgi:hypothetical protein
MDSSIVIPKKYVGIYGLDSFVTHSFRTSIKVEEDNKRLFEGVILKANFEKYLDTTLKKYGVLLYPGIVKSNDNIKVNYSVSIPLTDIGIGVSMIIKKEANIDFKGR